MVLTDADILTLVAMAAVVVAGRVRVSSSSGSRNDLNRIKSEA